MKDLVTKAKSNQEGLKQEITKPKDSNEEQENDINQIYVYLLPQL